MGIISSCNYPQFQNSPLEIWRVFFLRFVLILLACYKKKLHSKRQHCETFSIMTQETTEIFCFF